MPSLYRVKKHMCIDSHKTFLFSIIEQYEPKIFLSHSNNCIILVFFLYVPQVSEKRNSLHTAKGRLFVKSWISLS